MFVRLFVYLVLKLLTHGIFFLVWLVILFLKYYLGLRWRIKVHFYLGCLREVFSMPLMEFMIWSFFRVVSDHLGDMNLVQILNMFSFCLQVPQDSSFLSLVEDQSNFPRNPLKSEGRGELIFSFSLIWENGSFGFQLRLLSWGILGLWYPSLRDMRPSCREFTCSWADKSFHDKNDFGPLLLLQIPVSLWFYSNKFFLPVTSSMLLRIKKKKNIIHHLVVLSGKINLNNLDHM